VSTKIRTEDAKTPEMVKQLKHDFSDIYFFNSIRNYHSSIVRTLTSRNENYNTKQWNEMYLN